MGQQLTTTWDPKTKRVMHKNQIGNNNLPKIIGGGDLGSAIKEKLSGPKSQGFHHIYDAIDLTPAKIRVDSTFFSFIAERFLQYLLGNVRLKIEKIKIRNSNYKFHWLSLLRHAIQIGVIMHKGTLFVFEIKKHCRIGGHAANHIVVLKNAFAYLDHLFKKPSNEIGKNASNQTNSKRSKNEEFRHNKQA